MTGLSRRSLLALPALATAPRPNILWLSCEDTGCEIGCYGDPHSLTPNVDRLATQGVRYSHAYTVAGVCAPSRSGIITGMYPSTLGSSYMRCNIALPGFVRAFPAYLRDAGYYCTNNVKTDYNFPPPKDAWDEISNKAHWRHRPSGRPFFAVFNMVTSHESQVRLRGAAYDRVTDRLTPAQRQDPARLRTLPPYYPDTPIARRDWANYYEVITAVDHQVGDHLKELEAGGLLDNTIVFFWGDHGAGLPRAKRWLYEASTHVPLVIRIPEKLRTASQSRPNSVDDQLVSFLDLAPTVLNLAGVPLPKHLQGRAFLGPSLTAPRQYIYGARDRMDERYDCVRMVRDRRYRYLRNYMPHLPYMQHISYMEQGFVMQELRRLQKEGSLPPAARLCMGPTKPVEELYDAESDPYEINNLAGSAQHRQVLERLGSAHRQWALETRDLGLIPEPLVDERGKQLGNRYQVLHQPNSEQYIKRLHPLVEAANRQNNPSLLRQSLTDPDPTFRYWAVIGLPTSDVPAQLLQDPSPVVRIAAARKQASPAAIIVLINDLKTGPDYVRLQAAIALDELAPKSSSARPALQAARTDPNEYVGRVAEHALTQLG